MPTYEFTCRRCDKKFEVFTSISGKARVVCPGCSSGELREVFGAFFVGGHLSNPAKGRAISCGGSCHSCAQKCK